tara:strand:+ start:591 stop:800 length:210 start_codon:yes stop_codon:yes gene_type:complete
MCLGGGSVDPGRADTAEDIARKTDNAHINPVSQETTPQWKKDQQNTQIVQNTEANQELKVPGLASERYG